MFRTIRAVVTLFAIFAVLTGLIYPLLMTVIAQVIFPYQASGSLIQNGQSVGSSLIGQSFSDPKYIWGRLSSTPGSPYNAATSGGTNYSVMNEALTQQAQARIDALHAADPENHQPIPVDLVTASASGLDPHISPAAAVYQAERVARARGLTEAQVLDLIARHTEYPLLGFLGEARVNVLMLNLALDSVQ